MKNLALLLTALLSACFASVASAETINIAGASSARDSWNSACSEANIPTAEMYVGSAISSCVLSYPLTIPVGKTLDAIQVAYNNEQIMVGTPHIVAYLGQNRINPRLGAIAIAGASVNPSVVGPGFLNMPNLAIPIAAGSVYWVQIAATMSGEVSAVTVTYH